MAGEQSGELLDTGGAVGGEGGGVGEGVEEGVGVGVGVGVLSGFLEGVFVEGGGHEGIKGREVGGGHCGDGQVRVVEQEVRNNAGSVFRGRGKFDLLGNCVVSFMGGGA